MPPSMSDSPEAVDLIRRAGDEEGDGRRVREERPAVEGLEEAAHFSSNWSDNNQRRELQPDIYVPVNMQYAGVREGGVKVGGLFGLGVEPKAGGRCD